MWGQPLNEWHWLALLFLVTLLFWLTVDKINGLQSALDAHIEPEPMVFTTEIYVEPKYGCQYTAFKANGTTTHASLLLNEMGLPKCPAFDDVLAGGNPK